MYGGSARDGCQSVLPKPFLKTKTHLHKQKERDPLPPACFHPLKNGSFTSSPVENKQPIRSFGRESKKPMTTLPLK